MTTTTDYSNRQVDIELLKSVTQPQGAISVDIDFIPTAKRVTGIQKLFQRYAVLVLSGIDTIRFAEDQGGRLTTRVAAGTVSTIPILRHLFYTASASAVATMKADDANAVFGVTPDDERIDDAVITDVNIDYTKSLASVTVEISTVAGETAAFVIPIK